jgi:crossover junction endodeoxyribonuclease RuvC
MIILGIDPGTATMGYGIIKKEGMDLTCLEYGLIETKKTLSDAQRLRKIDEEIEKIFNDFSPKALAIEKVYFSKNVKTAMTVSQAKGIVMLKAAKENIPVYEFSPSQIKSTITGHGKAKKMQVQKMIKSQLRLKDVIDINKGKKVGYIEDVDIDLDSGNIKAIIIPSTDNVFLRLFSKKEDIVIKWNEINKIGEDVILVDLKNV